MILRILLLSFLLLSPTHLHAAEEQPDHQNFFQVLRHVYHTHPGLNAAREKLAETKELYPQATSGWRPTLGAEAGIFTTDIDNSNFGGGDGATTKDYSVTLDQPIWQGGKTFAETRRARALINAGEAYLHQAEQDILLEAIRAMLNVKRDVQLYNLRLKNQENIQGQRNGARARFDGGELTITDVDQAKGRLARADSAVINAKRAMDISMAEFEQITGLSADNVPSVPMLDFQFPDGIDELLAAADSQNPDLWIARYEQNAAEHGIDSVFRELLPRLSAYAAYNKSYDPQPGIITSSAVETLGLRAVIPLYQAGTTRSRLRQAKHSAKRSTYEAEDLQRQIRQDVLRNYRILTSAADEEEYRMIEITAAESTMHGVEEEAKLGQRTVLDILDASNDIITSQTALVGTKYQGELSNYLLAANLGLLNAANMGLITP